jgi:hypothetical protein
MAQDQRKESVNIELKDPSYVKIVNGAHASYGGSQMWFAPNGTDRGSGRLAGGGCGLVAMRFSPVLEPAKPGAVSWLDASASLRMRADNEAYAVSRLLDAK